MDIDSPAAKPEAALQMVAETKLAYFLNNQSAVDNVRSAIHSEDRPRTNTSNRDYFRWIQPVPSKRTQH